MISRRSFYALPLRPRIHRNFIWVLCILSCYSLGKIAALSLDGGDAQEVKVPPFQGDFSPPRTAQQTQAILRRDLFLTKVETPKLPGVKREDGPCLKAERPSSASVVLLNTITLQNPSKSLAIARVKGQSKTLTLRQGEIVPSAGRLDLIEYDKILYRNEGTGVCEFIAMDKRRERSTLQPVVLSPEEGKKLQEKNKGEFEVSNEGNRFKIKRSYITAGLGDLSSLLGEVEAVQIKNPDGTLSYKITGIAPESVFAKLGIQDEDQIKLIDDRPIRNQTQLFTLLNSFGTINELSITVLRDGTEQKLEYTFAD